MTAGQATRASSAEFVALIAMMMSVVALSIDALLPALGALRVDLRLPDPNQAQYVISALFMGMAFGQLVFGPLSDAVGRRAPLYLGLVLFFLGSALCRSSQTLDWMLVGRIVQGFGIAGPYVCAVSIVRDRCSGTEMARTMSLVMTIFFIVPAIAPSLGQLVMTLAGWRAIFTLYMATACLLAVWIALRLPETLPRERRTRFRLESFRTGFVEVVRHRGTRLSTVCIGLFFGGFIGYLNSSQQIFQGLFATGDAFTLYFGMLALILGATSLVNARVVRRLGMKALCRRASLCIAAASAVFVALNLAVQVELWMFLLYSAVLFACFGFMFGNLNAMAMEPMGHCAGIASAIIGTTSSLCSIAIGTLVGQLYDGTLLPIASAFLVLSLSSVVVMRAMDGGGPAMPQPAIAAVESRD